MKNDFQIYAGAWPYALKMLTLKKTVYKPVAELDAEYFASDEPVDFSLLKDKAFKPIERKEKWGGLYGCAWFKLNGKIPDDCKKQSVVAVVKISGEGCIYDGEGVPMRGLTTIDGGSGVFQPIFGKRVIEITPSSNGGERVSLLIDAGYNGFDGKEIKKAVFKSAQLCVVNNAAKEFFYDFTTAFLLYAPLAKGDAFKIKLKKLMDESYALATSKKPDFVKARETLSGAFAEESDLKRFTVYATGHAHLDLAWLWPIRETKRKAARTFSTALENIKKYDEYVFGASQPQQFEWIKKRHPELFEKIREAVANGRLEPQGGMWVEPDTNIPCGESLIRQVYYGKKFFKEEFGRDMKILWLPDVFGFSAQLPQIIKKTGMEYFLTIKISWNEHNEFPLHTFEWEGLDDSGVLAHMPPEGNYVSMASPLAVLKAFIKYKDKDRAPVAHMPFGDGDGGGGPGEAHLEFLKRMTRPGGIKGLPLVKHSSAEEFFDGLSQYRAAVKRHKGELYLEKHQGTLTTQARNKYYNRKAETILHNIEFLAAAASASGYEYDAKKIDEIWKEVLLYQFHDIIPGSSINRVYLETDAAYERILKELYAVQREIIDFLAARAKRPDAEQGGGEKKLFAVNPAPFVRSEYVKHGDKWYKADVMPYASAELVPFNIKTAVALDFSKNTISNEKLEVVFADSGYIKSLKDKESGAEYSGKALNRLVLYKDKKSHYNAWDIDINYPGKTKRYFNAVSSQTYKDGAAVVRETTYKAGRSTIRQKLILKKDADYLLFETQVDWREKHKMLRADFYPSVFADKATFDIQFGNIERSTKTDNPIDRAQFEVCAHKWVDVTDKEKNLGMTVINNCKYGHRVKDGLISLNLLRSTTFPDKTADIGLQLFTYALYPHAGGVFDGDAAPLGYFVNNPLIIGEKNAAIDTCVLTSKSNIIVETIKPTPDGGGITLRVYENRGEETVATIKTAFAYAAAYETDMLEEKYAGDCDLNLIRFKPYEIKTIVLRNA
ncbi:MAG: glycosyl hydrolase-related protein [Clostridiales bacterium]|jgi:alpha-mannosidase|nr:glycosyl hydrolase-related protein [Clostridiales bacterium]